MKIPYISEIFKPEFSIYLISEAWKVILRMRCKVTCKKPLVKLHSRMPLQYHQTSKLAMCRCVRKRPEHRWTLFSLTTIGRLSRYCAESATSISSSVAILKLLFSITCKK